MGSLAASLLSLNGRLHLAGWQWLFLIEGMPPLLLSVIFLKSLPDDPDDARWLTIAERSWLKSRLVNAESAHNSGKNLTRDLIDTLTNFRVWLLGPLLPLHSHRSLRLELLRPRHPRGAHRNVPSARPEKLLPAWVCAGPHPCSTSRATPTAPGSEAFISPFPAS